MTTSLFHALGTCVPPQTLSNDDLATFVDTNDKWIVERTGIRRRHRLQDGKNASDIGFSAAQMALANAGLEAGQLTHVITATCTPDCLTPSTACIIAGALNAGNAMAFDLNAACTGFIYSLSICDSILKAAPQSNILLVCVEALSRRLNWEDRGTCVLFGDAAAATVINTGKNAIGGLRDAICRSDGTQKDLITIGGGTACAWKKGDPVDDSFFLSMQGRDTYRFAVRQMVSVSEEILARNGLTVADIDLVVPHQANIRIIEAVGGRLKIAPEKVFINLENYGNTSAASIPLALSEALAQGRIKPGNRVLVTAFGAGLTWGAALLEFF